MVRIAKPEDAAEIHRILYQVNDVHAKGRPDIFKIGGIKYGPEETKKLIEDPDRQVYVCTGDGETILGYLIGWYEETPEDTSRHHRKTFYIDDLCVDERSRGQHAGKALYEYALQAAKENGCDSITLNVWECNTSARVFYEKMGLVPLKTTMEKILQPDQSL